MVFDYNIFADHHVVRSNCSVPVGKCMLRVKFVREGKTGSIILSIDGKECGAIPVPFVIRIISSTGMDIGRDSLSPVTDDYKAPFKFTGTIKRVNFELPRYKPPSQEKEDAKVRFDLEMSNQ